MRHIAAGAVLSLVFMAAVLTQGCAQIARSPSTSNPALQEALLTARVNSVELHYLDRGKGEPIIFVHGGLVDYREWGPVAGQLMNEFRTITYSRRYNFPNQNPLLGQDHSAIVEAADLAALNRHLDLGPMHIVGVSYGAYTALELALREPRMVRTLTLVEPPLLRWLPELPGGFALFDEFFTGTWRAAGRAFERGDSMEALRITLDYFVGPAGMDNIPSDARAVVMANAPEWRALTTSRDAFPPISREEVANLPMPVLMLSGGNTYPMLHLTDDELERNLKNGRRQIIPDGTHDVCSEQPYVCAEAVRAFLRQVKP